MMGDFRLWPLADIPPRVFDVCFQGQTGPVAQAGRLPILTHRRHFDTSCGLWEPLTDTRSYALINRQSRRRGYPWRVSG
jgi:hypothetical protein